MTSMEPNLLEWRVWLRCVATRREAGAGGRRRRQRASSSRDTVRTIPRWQPQFECWNPLHQHSPRNRCPLLRAARAG